MTTENELTLPVLRVLDESLLGELTTNEIRGAVKAMLKLSGSDMKPLMNRNDVAIDQKIRNIKCHRTSASNAIAMGLIEDVPKGLRITEQGREILRRRRT